MKQSPCAKELISCLSFHHKCAVSFHSFLVYHTSLFFWYISWFLPMFNFLQKFIIYIFINNIFAFLRTVRKSCNAEAILDIKFKLVFLSFRLHLFQDKSQFRFVVVEELHLIVFIPLHSLSCDYKSLLICPYISSLYVIDDISLSHKCQIMIVMISDMRTARLRIV